MNSSSVLSPGWQKYDTHLINCIQSNQNSTIVFFFLTNLERKNPERCKVKGKTLILFFATFGSGPPHLDTIFWTG